MSSDPNPYAAPKAMVADSLEVEERGPKPKQVTIAVRLIWTSLALGVLHALLIFGHLSSVGPVGVVITIQAVSVALVIWLAWKISAGRNWARITYLVLLLVGTPGFFMGEAQEFARAPVPGTIGLVQFILQVAALVLVFFEPGRRWFRRARA